MKEGIHPAYRPVVFKDISNGHTFLIGSTIKSSETITLEEGKEYPLGNMEISSTSHPFYTGQQRMVDTQGRVEKFKKKFGADPIEGQTKRKSRPAPKKQEQA